MAQFDVIALKPLFGPPSIVPPLYNDIDLLVAVLTDVSAEDPTPAVPAHWIPSVHGTAPHVPDPESKHLWPGGRIVKEGVVRRDFIPPTSGGSSVHIHTENFSQQCTPGGQKETMRFRLQIVE